MRRIKVATVVLLVAATGAMGFVPLAAQTPVSSGSAPESQLVGELRQGDALFWDGPYLDRVGTGTRYSDEVVCDSAAATAIGCDVVVANAQPSAIVANNAIAALGMEDPFCGSEHVCIDYAFDVTEDGDLLRVALDLQTFRDLIFVYVFDPNGTYVAKLTKSTAEAWLQQPATGRWTARVRAYDVRDASFRMRAALDPDDRPRRRGRDRAAQQRSGALLPNLQVVAPYELGFGPCQATEIVDYGAQRCLRFSTGPANHGDGPLDLLVTEVGSVEGQMHQRIHHADGSTETVPAGSFDYHHEHLHYHHGALQSLDVFRVTDARRGRMEPAGSGPKLGFCLAPYFIAEWDSFAQDPPYEIYGDNGCADYTGIITPPVGTQMALARGWVDIYAYWIEGNFVDFGDNPDGLYVIRAHSDPDGDIRETREDDNTSYTYFDVRGDHIEVLERGVGDDPWDPRKMVVDDTRRPTRWSEETSQ